MGRVVLVTGVSRDLGRKFARSLAADPGVSRVIGVDVVPPRGDVGDVSFVRADIRTPVIAKIIAKEDVDTVVHMSIIATPGSAGGRNTMKELNVIGTMQLLAACQRAESVQHLVVKSTTTVYGASNRDPAMFREDMEPRRAPRSGYAKDIAEIEDRYGVIVEIVRPGTGDPLPAGEVGEVRGILEVEHGRGEARIGLILHLRQLAQLLLEQPRQRLCLVAARGDLHDLADAHD
mgnify:CR=1 FL=1